ncbi:MAG: hypothetical protein WDW36_009819 [Sanguina aurantia]
MAPAATSSLAEVQSMVTEPSAVASVAAAAAAVLAEVPAGMTQESALLDAFCEVPSISRVILRQPAPGGPTLLTAHLTQRDLPANSVRKYSVSLTLSPSGQAGPCSLPTELPAALLMSVSPSGTQQLVIKPGGEGVSIALQLWSGGRLAWEIHAPKALHGPLVNDGYFSKGGGLEPGRCPPSERTPAWGGPDSLKDTAGPKSWRGVGTVEEDWGELNTGKRPPQLFVLDLSTRTVLQTSASFTSDLSIGLPAWCPTPASLQSNGSGDSSSSSSYGLVVTAWPAHNPSFPGLGRKLGVVFCYNRPCQLHHLALSRAGQKSSPLSASPSSTLLTPSLGSAFSAAFSPSGAALVFLSQQRAIESGTHSATAELLKLPRWTAPPPPLPVIQLVHTPGADAPTSSPAPDSTPSSASSSASSSRPFPGLYCAGLSEDCFIGPSTLLLTSQWYGQSTVLAVDIDRLNSVTPLTPVDGPDCEQACWALLGCGGGMVAASRVSPNCPPALYIAALPPAASQLTQSALQWQAVAGVGCAASQLPPAAADALAAQSYRVLSTTPTIGDVTTPFETLVWYPKGKQGPFPTILVPHGGPHTATLLGWYMPYAFLVSLGYCVMAPNYRGSTGYGQAALGSLAGHIGGHDVADCMASLAHGVAEGLVAEGRVAVVGGSHGGFLTLHLLGQHPGAFAAGAARNPVCDIALMVGVSDIPDWCYVEVFGGEEGMRRATSAPTPADLARMFEMSPIAHVQNIKAPLLFVLGAKDRRVPMADGLQFLSALKSQGAPTRLLTFPEDTHALDRPQTEYEQWVNIAWWLKKHMPEAAPSLAAHAAKM